MHNPTGATSHEEEGGSYGAVAALGVLQIIPLLIIVMAPRVVGMRIKRRSRM